MGTEGGVAENAYSQDASGAAKNVHPRRCKELDVQGWPRDDGES